jgi:predicted outer membrane repeat protein
MNRNNRRRKNSRRFAFSNILKKDVMMERLEERLLLAIVVTNLNDSGPGSLRYAVNLAASNPGDDDIIFDRSMNGDTIILNSCVNINDSTGSVSIIGTKGLEVIISGNNKSSAFYICSKTFISDIKFIDCNNTFGGAIYNNSQLTLDRTLFRNNSASRGGALYNDGTNYGCATASMTDSVFEMNTAYAGGAVYNDSSYCGNANVIIENSLLSNNSVTGLGGSISTVSYYGGEASVIIRGSKISDCTSRIQGGAIQQIGYSGSTSTIIQDSVIENCNSTGGGGAIESHSDTIESSNIPGFANLVIERSVVSNCSGDFGGALLLSSGKSSSLLSRSNVSIQLTTINDCNATKGGGIFEVSDGYLDITIRNSTIAGNNATIGGGLYINNAIVLITNSIIADNTASYSGPDVFGMITNCESSLFGNKTSGYIINESKSIIGVPLLGKLENFGGKTKTLPLLPGSPAIGSGNMSMVGTTDQRGATYLTADIGAFAMQKVAVDLTASRNYSRLNQTITFNADLSPSFGNLTNGIVSFYDGTSILANVPVTGGWANLTTPDLSLGDHNISAVYQGSAGFSAAASNNITLHVFPEAHIYVTNLNDSGPGSLRDAIRLAASYSGDDEIYFASDLASGTITLTSPLMVNDYSGALNIVGPASNSITISGNNATGIFNISSKTEISHVTMTDGSFWWGGAIYSRNASVTLNYVAFVHNSATTQGGAICSNNSGGVGSLIINNCEFEQNTAYYTASAIYTSRGQQ